MVLRMRPDILRKEEQKLLENLKDFVLAHGLIMAGGTALAITLGHRRSVDFDFFTNKPFSVNLVLRELEEKGFSFEVLVAEEETLILTMNQTKVSFFYNPYPLPAEKHYQDIPLAGIRDIAAMKLLAISQRGAKRDFIDLYFILQEIPFHKVAEALINRYGKHRINPVHIGKSLVYFFDAEPDPDPEYLEGYEVDWEEVKAFFKGHVKQFVLDLEEAKRDR